MNNEMSLEQIKQKMKDYEDLFGYNLHNRDQIDFCETKEELAKLIDSEWWWIEEVATDNQSKLSRFKESLGL